MKCKNCGHENKSTATFCTKCGHALYKPEPKPQVSREKSNNSKYVILILVVVVIILAALTVSGFNGDLQSLFTDDDSNLTDNNLDNQSVTSYDDVKTQEAESKSWEKIGSYSGSGSGHKTIDIPAGKIKVKFSAYPIKNYADNYLSVSGSNGEYGSVEWGSKSAVETRSDSLTYTSSSLETFTIDYYETVSWEVEVYSYQ